jgi:hypothetical protein
LRTPFRGAAAMVPLRGTLVVLSLCGLVACKPALVVGEFTCPADGAEAGTLPSKTDPIAIPWETGFENGPCDYRQVTGFCYSFPPVVFRIVDQPVHSGQYAAEISVVTGTDGGEQPQGRCARQGGLPAEAYYGAWFLLPRPTTNLGLWNLFHFRSDSQPPGLWDVSLTKDSTLELFSQRFQNGNALLSPPVPIGSWFHVVLYLKRAKDTTGAVALYLDNQKLYELTNLITDDTDWGQWYVGSLASNLQPPEATVYVDDVSIHSTL